MLDINHILESIIGLTTASILVKLLDKLIEKMCEYHDCRTLREQEDEERVLIRTLMILLAVIIILIISCSLRNNHFNISATNSATM